MKSPIEELEEAIENCKVHYAGMHDAYKKILRAIELNHSVEEIKELCGEEIARIRLLM
jgi:hypothetical protein